MSKIIKLIAPVLILPAYLYFSLYYVTAAPVHLYADTDGNWAAVQIVKWCDRGVLSLSEIGWFRPKEQMNLSEVCSVFARILPLEAQAENRYPDVEDDRWYTEPLLQCVASGIVLPRGERLIQPLKPLLRGEVYPMVARAFDLTPAYNSKALSNYYGAETLPDDVRPYFEALAELDLIGGEHPMHLRLDEPFTREEMADLLTRLQRAGLIE